MLLSKLNVIRMNDVFIGDPQFLNTAESSMVQATPDLFSAQDFVMETGAGESDEVIEGVDANDEMETEKNDEELPGAVNESNDIIQENQARSAEPKSSYMASQHFRGMLMDSTNDSNGEDDDEKDDEDDESSEIAEVKGIYLFLH